MVLKNLLSVSVLAVALTGAASAQEDFSVPAEPAQEERVEPMGWSIPLSPLGEDEEPSELDRLSMSPSGTGIVSTVYDSKADNPLEAVSVTIRALDKITATYKDIEIPIGEEVSYGALKLLPRTCDKRPPEEVPETTVFLEVFTTEEDVQGARTRAARDGDELPSASTIRLPGEVSDDIRQETRPALFRGWMFASSPSLNALEHPVYDVWVIDCKMIEPGI